MTNSFKVRRGAYKRLTQAELVVYAGNIFDRMSSMAEYQSFSTPVNALGEQLGRFRTAMNNAVLGGTDRVTAKNEAKAGIFPLLDQLAQNLEGHQNGTELWIVNAGFDLAGRTNKRLQGDIPAPGIAKLVPTGNVGELDIRIQLPDIRMVYSNAVEFSTDNGATWHIGTYSTGRRIRVKNLPSKTPEISR